MSSKWVVTVILLSVVLVGGISSAFACVGGVLDVAQPLVSGDMGIVVSPVSYIRNCLPSVIIPGYEICFVGEPSCVCEESSGGKSVNVNAANLVGITATVDSFHMKTNRLLGDTLHAIIDLSHMKPLTDDLHHQLRGWSVDAVVRATVESVLATAYNHRRGVVRPDTALVEAQYLRLEIQGAAEYENLGGVFSFDALGHLPRQRQFFP